MLVESIQSQCYWDVTSDTCRIAAFSSPKLQLDWTHLNITVYGYNFDSKCVKCYFTFLKFAKMSFSAYYVNNVWTIFTNRK